MYSSGITYCGKPIEELSKEELIKALVLELNAHEATRDTLAKIVELNNG